MRHNPPRKAGRPRKFRETATIAFTADKFQIDFLKGIARQEHKSVSEIIRSRLFSSK